jgi:hypothetical protein
MEEKKLKKEIHIRHMRCKSLENEKLESHHIPEINKNSLSIIKKNKRKPLYQQKCLKDEKSLEKNFQYFYTNTAKYNITNTCSIDKIRKKPNHYDQFYNNMIQWKKKIEQENEKIKKNNEEKYKKYLDSVTFKPTFDKKSLNIANKLYKNRSIENPRKINWYKEGNDEISHNKLKAKLKPLINNIYNNYNYKIALYKKCHVLQKNLSYVNLNDIRNYNDYYKINKNQNNGNKMKINYKLNETKYKNQKKRKSNEKFEEKKTNFKKKNTISLEEKLGRIKKPKKKDKIRQDMYILNVRPGTSWNYDVVNEITPFSRVNNFIENIINE